MAGIERPSSANPLDMLAGSRRGWGWAAHLIDAAHIDTELYSQRVSGVPGKVSCFPTAARHELLHLRQFQTTANSHAQRPVFFLSAVSIP